MGPEAKAKLFTVSVFVYFISKDTRRRILDAVVVIVVVVVFTVSRRLTALLGLPNPGAEPLSSDGIFSFFQRFPPSSDSVWGPAHDVRYRKTGMLFEGI